MRRFVLLVACGLLAVTSIVAQPSRTYRVKTGDTLFRIARNHDTTVERLQRINGLRGTTIRVGQVLTIQPAPSAPSPQRVDLEPPRIVEPVVDSTGVQQYAHYTAGPDETLFDIALRFGLTVDTLEALNPVLPVVFADAEPIRVPAEFAMRSYRVRAGDTLFGIARSQGVSVTAIRSANGLTGDRITIGQNLQIPSGAAPPSAELPPVAAEGTVTVYPDRFEGRLMASGRAYEKRRLTVAHPDWPLGTILLLEHAEAGRSVFAEVADRMPTRSDHLFEVSAAVRDALQLDGDTIVTARILSRTDRE